MNKKFSTLVASLLLSSAFSVYAGNAKPMLATPTQVETRATSADVEEAVEVTGTLPSYSSVMLTTPESGIKMKDKVFACFNNDSRIAFVGNLTNAVDNPYFITVDGTTATTGNISALKSYDQTKKEDYYWTLNEGRLVNDAGRYFTVDNKSDNLEIIPVKQNGENTEYFAIARRNPTDGKLSFVQWNTTGGQVLSLSTTTYASASAGIEAGAALFVSVETAYVDPIAGDDLNKELGDGFELSVFSKVDKELSVVNADIFSGKLKTQQNTNWYQIKNAAGKYIIFDTDEKVTSDGYSKMGKFKEASSPSGCSWFQILKADNGSEDIIVKVADSNNPSSSYRLYIANAAGTYVLTVAENNPVVENWAGTVLGGDNYVDLKQFLRGQYVTVDFVKAADSTDPNNDYKKNGRLAVLYNTINSVTTNHADYVLASSLYEKAPEAQWAVSSKYSSVDGSPYFSGSITLTNRENPDVEIVINEKGLRKVRNTTDTYEVVDNIANTNIKAGEQIKISFVENADKHDGYAVFNANDLRNETWYLGQVRQAEADENDLEVYWTENHVASHQIGATVEKTNASRWNLSLVTKNTEDDAYNNQIDSVLVVSTLNNWNSEKNRIDAVKDTLVIFPYAFQNRANDEFVKFNDAANLDYYECRAYEQDQEKKFDKSGDARFALKLKADGTYNYVALPSRDEEDYAANGTKKVNVTPSQEGIATKKVFQENSTILGTWSQMNMYQKDANSLMFVEKAAAPEYRKLETSANLDTIKIYRADNEAQVVYEKRDAKSVVDGRTLSFLNIDNDAQFTQINPALYADTAYVNRGNNTRYQYLLGVNIEHTEGFYCPIHGFTAADDCGHAVPVSYNKGRYLINMIDTANVYGKTAGIHNNPYINETEEGRTLSKLSFVDAIHVLTDGVKPEQADKLYVINNGDTTEVALGTESLNTVKFAFKYIDSMESSDFKIQTLYKPYAPSVYGTSNYGKGNYAFTEEGYLRWVNGCLVVDSDYTKGDVFNMDENETRTPTANEEITAEGNVIVAGTNGAVVVKGAEGKSVIVSTILGKVVANEVLTSDNAQITAPQGVVVVSVDGESFKVVVK